MVINTKTEAREPSEDPWGIAHMLLITRETRFQDQEKEPSWYKKILIKSNTLSSETGVFNYTDLFVSKHQLIQTKHTPTRCQDHYLVKKKIKNTRAVGEDVGLHVDSLRAWIANLNVEHARWHEQYCNHVGDTLSVAPELFFPKFCPA